MPSDLISASAILCEKVLKDQDGLLSAIRIADTISVPRSSPTSQFFIVVFVRSSAVVSSQRLMSVHLRQPGETTVDVGTDKVAFDRPDESYPMSATMVLEFWLTFKDSGLHWINVKLDGEDIATAPLMVYFKAPA
jgi:hypothetical protein